jgi:hypothetical protein
MLLSLFIEIPLFRTPRETTKSKDVLYKSQNVLRCGGYDTQQSTIGRLQRTAAG